MGVDRSQAMNTFFRGLGSISLGTLAGAGLGGATFFATEVLLPKQAEACPAHTHANQAFDQVRFDRYVNLVH